MRRSAVFLTAAILAGCFTASDEGESPVSVPLSDTRLAGSYALADYLFEYGDGGRLDPSILKVTGTLDITGDSVYREGIRVGEDSTLTTGRIMQVLILGGDRDRGELLLTLGQGDSSASGKTAFSFRHDTLVLVTEISKERDAAKKGFRETAYYSRESATPSE
ncbi:MAG: hypothetical protein JWP91_250 [Fibrobacteres bacterium]|nr:hypothetical protein [Fibrobacterota bacterium]